MLCSSFDLPSMGRQQPAVLHGAVLRWKNVALGEPGATARLHVMESLSHLLAVCYSDSLPSVKNLHLISTLNFSDLSFQPLCTVFIRSKTHIPLPPGNSAVGLHCL